MRLHWLLRENLRDENRRRVRVAKLSHASMRPVRILGTAMKADAEMRAIVAQGAN
jgi:hypothetical protein